MKSRLGINNYLAVLICLIVLGQCWSSSAFAGYETAKLLASDGAANDYFGRCVSIWGDTAVVGAYYDDDHGSSSGSAYIFRFNGSNWVQEAKLLASDGAVGDYFGISVGICDNTVIVGAHRDDDNGNNSGSAYIFRFNGSSWVQEAKLLANDGSAEDLFGYSVGIWGDTAVIGAYYDDNEDSNNGSAYIFRFNGSSWAEEAKLLASDGSAEDLFGCSVGIWGDTAVIGAYLDDDKGSSSGSVYVFRFDDSEWVQGAKLLASDGAAADYFGLSVGINGDKVIVGAVSNDDKGVNSGSAYIFRSDSPGWVEEAKLLASDGAGGDWFGYSVGIWCDAAVIGARYDADKGSDSGSAYVFWFNGASWAQKAKLLASDGAAFDWFGNSVGISYDTVIIGAEGNDDNGSSSGSAYIFGPSGSDLDLDDDVDFEDISILAEHWLEGNCGLCRCGRADCTEDGEVNLLDYAEIAAHWLEGVE
jgi:hypothetical protein